MTGTKTALPLAGIGNIPLARGNGTRVVITGKGGVGKTTIAALLAHQFAREGRRVLAVDGDPQQNLAATLGISPEEAERIVPVAGSAAYLREKTGAGPGLSYGGLLTLNPDVGDVIDRFSVTVSGNLRLLVMGGVRQAGSGCLCPEYTLLAAIFRHMPLLADEVVILDTPAGLEHFGRAVADGFTCAVVVTDLSYNALSVARESAALARQLGIGQRILAVNRADGLPDRNRAADRAGIPGNYSGIVVIPFDAAVTAAEPDVSPLISGDSGFMRAVQSLARTITSLPDTSPGFFP